MTKKMIILSVMAAAILFAVYFFTNNQAVTVSADKKYIKWVDFSVPSNILDRALKYDISSVNDEIKLDWIELLAYLSSKNGGNYSKSSETELVKLVDKLRNKETMEELTKDMKYYSYYKEAYTAVLGGFVGQYSVQEKNKETEEILWVQKYGLKAFNPIARGFYYSQSDDFGNKRNYGFARKHLGHDMMANIGAPVIAVESGTIEALGWNQYGGWRIGIRSHDKKRYYYYAHLRKDRPYAANLKEGDRVNAGDVIGFVGRTGYSRSENVNNIQTPHLHFGMQLIFNESQKDGNNEIWIDVYQIVKLLEKNKVLVKKDEETKEYVRAYGFSEPLPLE